MGFFFEKHTTHKERLLSNVSIPLQKQELRKKFIAKRNAVPKERRIEANQALLDKLLPKLSTYSYVVSFYSLPDEIDLFRLNAHFASARKLLLARFEASEFKFYQVENLENLLDHPKWSIKEPDPEICPLIPLEEIEIVLVPGIVFDSDGYRIGHGGGYYDRLLSILPRSTQTWGLGFSEQHASHLLPRENHDQRLNKTILY